jgi:hypothetical protein
VITQRNPGTAPRDGRYFALFTADWDLKNCRFDSDEQGGCFIVAGIVDSGKHLSPTLMGYVGWSNWSDVFAHIRDTARMLDKDEVIETQFEAQATIASLRGLVLRPRHSDPKNVAERAIATIKRLLKLMPPGYG